MLASNNARRTSYEELSIAEAVFELSIDEGDKDTSAYLRPQSNDDNRAKAFASLSADVAGACAENPAAAIHYILAGPGSVSLFGLASRLYNNKEGIEDKGEFKASYKRYIGIEQKETALNWSRHASVLLVSSKLRPHIKHGVCGLNVRKPRGEFLDASVNSPGLNHQPLANYCSIRTAIEGYFNAPNGGFPVIALSMMDISGSRHRTYSSVLNILGLISALLEIDPSGQENPLNKIRTAISKVYPSISVSTPELWGSKTPILEGNMVGEVEKLSPGNEVKESIKNGVSDNSFDDISERVLLWLSHVKKFYSNVTPSSVLLGKIWIRIYFSLEKVSDAISGKFCTASIMEMFALCVINSFYVEELAYYSSASHLDRVNPLHSSDEFYNKFKDRDKGELKLGNLTVVGIDPNMMPLTYIIVTCPLFLGLLHPVNGRDFFESILKSLGINEEDRTKWYCDNLMWNSLERTFIYGVKYTKESLVDKTEASISDALYGLPREQLAN